MILALLLVASVEDDRRFEPIAVDNECALAIARRPSELPRREWRSCGAGCREMTLSPRASSIGMAARTRADGEIEVRLSSTGERWGLDEIVRASDGAILLALRRDRDCLSAAGAGAPELFRVKHRTSAEEEARGVRRPTLFGLAAADGRVRWSSSAGSGGEAFAFDRGFGVIAGGASVNLVRDVGSGRWESVLRSRGYALHPIASGEVLAFVDFGAPRAALRLLARDGKSAELFAEGHHAVWAAIGAERFVWIGASGAAALDGRFESARVFWSRRADRGVAHGPVIAGPIIPGASSRTGPIVTHGSFAATTLGSGELILVELDAGSSTSSRVIPPRQGRVFVSALAIDDRRVLVAERAHETPVAEIDALVSIDLRYSQGRIEASKGP